jgi:hypothetical protein
MPGANLLGMLICKGYPTKMERKKSKQQQQGNKTLKAR